MFRPGSEDWQVPHHLGACVCSQLRRTARKVSSVYDKALGDLGLTITQHALLVRIARAGTIGRTALAENLGMERTTLTRNLKPLEKAKLVVPAASNDKRERLLRVSAEGKRRLRESYRLWEQTQREMTTTLGPGALAQLRKALDAAENAAAEMLKAP